MASKSIHQLFSDDFNEIEHIISVFWNAVKQFLQNFFHCLGIHGAINIDKVDNFWNVEKPFVINCLLLLLPRFTNYSMVNCEDCVHELTPLMIRFVFHDFVHIGSIFAFDQMFFRDFSGKILKTALQTFPQRVWNNDFFPKVIILHVEEDPEISQHFMNGKLKIIGFENA